MFDAFLLMPTGPSMLDARDAQLGADRLRFGGANQTRVLARVRMRGFGEAAASTNAQRRATPSRRRTSRSRAATGHA